MSELILGKTVTVIIDRPLGSSLPDHPELRYPVNFGCVDTAFYGGTPQEAYVLGVEEPVPQFTGRVIGVIHRYDSADTKWVVVPAGLRVHQAQIMEQVHFQEQFHRAYVNAQFERSCGVIPYQITDRGIEYLLVLQRGSHTWSFPKGHMEPFETEAETAARELWEETQQVCRLLPGFRETVSYSLGHRRSKTVVLFLGQALRETQVQRAEVLEARFLPMHEALLLLQPNGSQQLPYPQILTQAEQRILSDCI